MAIHDIEEYKKAKTILPHLEQILRVLDLTEQSLSYFKSYIPISSILVNIKEQRIVLEAYRKKFKDIKTAKGKRK